MDCVLYHWAGWVAWEILSLVFFPDYVRILLYIIMSAMFYWALLRAAAPLALLGVIAVDVVLVFLRVWMRYYYFGKVWSEFLTFMSLLPYDWCLAEPRTDCWEGATNELRFEPVTDPGIVLISP